MTCCRSAFDPPPVNLDAKPRAVVFVMVQAVSRGTPRWCAQPSSRLAWDHDVYRSKIPNDNIHRPQTNRCCAVVATGLHATVGHFGVASRRVAYDQGSHTFSAIVFSYLFVMASRSSGHAAPPAGYTLQNAFTIAALA